MSMNWAVNDNFLVAWATPMNSQTPCCKTLVYLAFVSLASASSPVCSRLLFPACLLVLLACRARCSSSAGGGGFGMKHPGTLYPCAAEHVAVPRVGCCSLQGYSQFVQRQQVNDRSNAIQVLCRYACRQMKCLCQ